MQSIICAVDFSVSSNHAAVYAAGLASEFNARLTLLHVHTPQQAYNRIPAAVIEDISHELKDTALRKMATLKKSLLRKFDLPELETYALSGLPAEVILSTAKERGAELIVMGSTGTSRLERLLIGSVTSKVLGTAGCPVLCIPREAIFKPIRKILFATDLKEDNIKAALSIVRFAKHFDAEISFVYVDDKNLMHSEKDILAMTKRVRSKVRYSKLSGFIAKGKNITQGLEGVIRKQKAQILVMMTHERHFPANMYSQSLTKMMSHQTKIPLLAIKPGYKSL